MKNPITDRELNAANVRVMHVVPLAKAVASYRVDVLCMRRCLKDYVDSPTTYNTLLANFAKVLLDKYGVFVDEMVEGMPENDLEVYDDLEGETYEPDEER